MTERQWKKSSRSGTGGSCVEVADEPGVGRLVRNSNYPDAGTITLATDDNWAKFLKAVRARDFAHQPGGVEVELLADGGARMTKDDVVLVFTKAEWDAWEGGVADGEFD
ncbi:MAG TPA: DUF397 domain-containing protein [Amycolatopsis sp.]|uniref:DUF397 domain-containing protein n=1 Tax=Amycolatopsis sp. TaxID=37632 RepID=UPI002B4A3908|nr:DUF397 domain-containing protein [Amycolatopsis sp.]HKS46716.1 DUF397 domain-containing protein [Amycolatopsis sp.]